MRPEEISYILLVITSSIITTIVHKKKGYSAFAGFCLGFFLTLIGVSIVSLEKTKTETDIEKANKSGPTMGQWIVIFVSIGITIMILFYFVLRVFIFKDSTKDDIVNTNQLNINYSSNVFIDSNFNHLDRLYYYVDSNVMQKSFDNIDNISYSSNNPYLKFNISYEDNPTSDINNYITEQFDSYTFYNLIDSYKVSINSFTWDLFYYANKAEYTIVYATDYNGKRFEATFVFEGRNYSESIKIVESIVNTFIFKT